MCPVRVTWRVMSAGERDGWPVSDEGRCWKAGYLALSDNFLLGVTCRGGGENFGTSVAAASGAGRAAMARGEVVTAAVDEAVAADVAGSYETSGCPPSSSR